MDEDKTPIQELSNKYERAPWRVGTWLENCFHFGLKDIMTKYPPALAHSMVASIRHHILKESKNAHYKKCRLP